MKQLSTNKNASPLDLSVAPTPIYTLIYFSVVIAASIAEIDT